MVKSDNLLHIEVRLRETAKVQEEAKQKVVDLARALTARLTDLRRRVKDDPIQLELVGSTQDIIALIAAEAVLVSATQKLGADTVYHTVVALGE